MPRHEFKELQKNTATTSQLDLLKDRLKSYAKVEDMQKPII